MDGERSNKGVVVAPGDHRRAHGAARERERERERREKCVMRCVRKGRRRKGGGEKTTYGPMT
jgi:hypothetical protein